MQRQSMDQKLRKLAETAGNSNTYKEDYNEYQIEFSFPPTFSWIFF